jgi:hypothetical protein
MAIDFRLDRTKFSALTFEKRTGKLMITGIYMAGKT